MTLRLTESDLAEIQRRRAGWAQRFAPEPRSVFPLSLNLRLHSIANERIHYMARHRHMKAHRSAVLEAIAGRAMPKLPAVVTIVRIGPRKLDTDNLAIACKGIRDGLAEAWRVDDGSDLYDWRYAQEQAGRGVYGVRIEVTPV